MKKKSIKIMGIFILVIIGLLIATPFFLETKIGDILKKNVNNNISATFDFSDADLSLISSFPNVEVRLKGVSLVNKAPFEGDTLLAAKELALKMGLGELFKGGKVPSGIRSLLVDEAVLNIEIDHEKRANYDIAKAIFYNNNGITDMVRVIKPNITLDMVKEIQQKYLERLA